MLILVNSYYHVICYKTYIVTCTEKGIKNYINQSINQSADVPGEGLKVSRSFFYFLKRTWHADEGRDEMSVRHFCARDASSKSLLKLSSCITQYLLI